MANFIDNLIGEDPLDYTFPSTIKWPSIGTVPELELSSIWNKCLLFYNFESGATKFEDKKNNNDMILQSGNSPTVSSETTILSQTQNILDNTAVGRLKAPIGLYSSQLLKSTLACSALLNGSSSTIAIFNESNGFAHAIQVDGSNNFVTGYFVDSGTFISYSNSAGSGWKHLASTVDFVFNGTDYDITLKVYIDSILINTYVDNGHTPANFGQPLENSICSLPNFVSSFFNGKLTMFYHADDVLTPTEITKLYNDVGVGYQYPINLPELTKNAPFTDSQLASFGGFSETSTGAGSLGYRLSSDDYVTTKYWNGSSWDNTGTAINIASTVNTNIPAFDAVPQQISLSVFFVSDGFQQIAANTLTINYAVNIGPTVNAGLNKPTGGDPVITVVDSFKPSPDGTATDVDGTITKIEVAADGGSFVNIPIGPYASLVEAWHNDDYNASVFGTGTVDFVVRVTDNFGATAQDTVQVTIINDNTGTINDTNTQVTALTSALAVVDALVDTINATTVANQLLLDKLHANQIADEETDSNGNMTWKNSGGTTLESFKVDSGTLFQSANAIVKKTRIP